MNIKFIVAVSMTMSICGCRNMQQSEMPFLSKEVKFKVCDTLIHSESDTLLYSDFLHPLQKSEKELVAFDILTGKILHYDRVHQNNSYLVDIKTMFAKYRSLPTTLFGVVEINPDEYLICSEPYFLLINNNMDILKVYDTDFFDNRVKYYVVGDASQVKYSKTQNCVYFPVAPSVSKEDDGYFSLGRVAELNLNTGDFGILPLGLPSDYKAKTDYKLFSLPLIDIVGDNLFCIYPGSMVLYKCNLSTHAKTSIVINPQNAVISAKEVGNNMEDMSYSYFECGNFYQMFADENKLLLFYWQGKQRKTYNRKNGIAELDCYVLAYSHIDNEIIFDVPFDFKDVQKNPLMFQSDTLYMVKKCDENITILGYEMEIN